MTSFREKYRYEYWPPWLFYLPILPLYLLHAVRLQSLVYFTWVNPSIEYGGFFGEKKDLILSQIPKAYKTPWLKFLPQEAYCIDKLLTVEKWGFPIVIKPNVGERGKGVVRIENKEALKKEIKNMDQPFLIQPFIKEGREYGVLFIKMPGETKGKVTSITGKRFIEVTGDGKSTIGELMSTNYRFSRQIERLKKSKPLLLSKILERGEKQIIESIGNHCLGTEFTNENTRINEKVNDTFSKICVNMDGFYYGRFDLIAQYENSLETGEGLHIFELNGVASEPGHIYATSHTLLKAYKDTIAHWKLIYEIAKKLKKQKIQPYSTREIWKVVKNHFFFST